MNCSNTVMDGFYFWIGKALAEVALAGVVFGIVLVFYAIYFWCMDRKYKRNKK